jgi:starch synthase (maltosyl-transferring)
MNAYPRRHRISAEGLSVMTNLSPPVAERYGYNAPPGTNSALSALAANRIVFEEVSTEIDSGRFAAKCVAGEPVTISVEIFEDGHDCIDACILYRAAGDENWSEQPMTAIGRDRWETTLTFEENGLYQYTFLAWRDAYATLRRNIRERSAGGQSIGLDIEEALRLLRAAVQSSRRKFRRNDELNLALTALAGMKEDSERLSLLMSDKVATAMRSPEIRENVSRYDKILEIFADRKVAAFGAWYELFPRSQSGDAARHGDFDDVIARLPYVRDLGFDVLYLTPIHPIGTTNRKGRNNSLKAEPGDVGCPYAIGSPEGGHDAIHPELGTFDDFARLMAAARRHGLEIALDLAFHCSPDHPWIKEHPEWFDWRSDGSIKFAENPPKKYEDIVSLNFYGAGKAELWRALLEVVLFWADKGVKIFRVDNPHTKPFPFWEWLLKEVRAVHPDTIFLSEAFTRLRRMRHLAKIGFSQTYTLFAWQNKKHEIENYIAELTSGEARHYLRPNFFANTPDINPVYLQESGRPGFQIRLVLAGTLAGNYGIYNGFEICEARAVPGTEDYLDSEKYELIAWDMDRPENIKWDIRFVNRIRNRHRALQEPTAISFYNAWNDNILYYGRRTADLSDFLLFHVCLDPHHDQHADFEVPLWEFGLPDDASIEVEDLVAQRRFTWHGKRQHIHLNPHCKPYAVWRLIPPARARINPPRSHVEQQRGSPLNIAGDR